MKNLTTDIVKFSSREDRSVYIREMFSSYVTGGDSLLDVGADKCHLQSKFPGIKYTGIDISGAPAIPVDLEKEGLSIFPNDSFSSVVCSDVLEHLDNLHNVFDEIIRVTKPNGIIIVSLPNNWANARRPIEKGRGQFSFYGLPVEKPSDRHKWFFNTQDAYEFFSAAGNGPHLDIKEIRLNEKKRSSFIKIARKIRYPGIRYLNRYCHTIWCIFKKVG